MINNLPTEPAGGPHKTVEDDSSDGLLVPAVAGEALPQTVLHQRAVWLNLAADPVDNDLVA